MLNFSFFFSWNSVKNKNKNKKLIINFGPQHPAAHGVLRLILQLSGEIIEKTDIHIGLLHRSTESLIETKHYIKSIPYFDRLDYVSMMSQEHAYCLTIERLLGREKVSTHTDYIRILFDELTRILNHMLAIACHALDVGSMSSIFWSFEERENIMEFYERVSGARMHAAFHKPGELFNFCLEKNLLIDILSFVNSCFKTLNEMHNVLTYNKVWKQRLLNIGSMGVNSVVEWNLTGVMARAVGLKKDLRLSTKHNYSSYNTIPVRSFLGVNGDCYDRYLIRMLEMGESLNIINIVTNSLFYSKYNSNKIYQSLINKNFTNKASSTYMEEIINHFLEWHSGLYIKSNIVSSYIESPKGEFGTIILSNNSSKPKKCKIRSPSYFNLQMISKLSKGHYLADLAALIGTVDIVFGEIDR